MKHHLKRTAASVALIGILAFTSSHAFDTEIVEYDPGPGPSEGWLAQTDIFWGYVGGVGPTYWGWTMARYSRSGVQLDLARQSYGRDANQVDRVVDFYHAGTVTYLVAEWYWLDSDWISGKSKVWRVSGFPLYRAEAKVLD
jgi:hypothetical protein